MMATRWGVYVSVKGVFMVLLRTRIVFKEQGVYYVKSGNKSAEVASSSPVHSLLWLQLGHVLLILLRIANA